MLGCTCEVRLNNDGAGVEHGVDGRRMWCVDVDCDLHRVWDAPVEARPGLVTRLLFRLRER